jgi:hypothetical protein
MSGHFRARLQAFPSLRDWVMVIQVGMENQKILFLQAPRFGNTLDARPSGAGLKEHGSDPFRIVLFLA